VFEEGDHRRDDKRFTAEALRAVKPGLEKIKARFGIFTEELAAIALSKEDAEFIRKTFAE